MRAVAGLSVIAALACAESSAVLDVVDAIAPVPVTADAMAVYFTIRGGAVADTLVAVSAPLATRAAVHGYHRGVMRAVGPVEIPARGIVRLQPGELHVMLEVLARLPTFGDTVELTLSFRGAGTRSVRAPVVRYEDLDRR